MLGGRVTIYYVLRVVLPSLAGGAIRALHDILFNRFSQQDKAMKQQEKMREDELRELERVIEIPKGTLKSNKRMEV